MSKEEYEGLKAEMASIADTVKLFPDDLQGRVFSLLVGSLTGKPVPPEVSTSEINEPVEASSALVQPSSRNYVEEFKRFCEEKTLGGKRVNEQEFAAVAAYYFAFLAPEEHKLETFTEENLADAYKYADRKPPTRIDSVLSNAKSKKLFDSEKRGVYKISVAGQHLVKNDLPRKPNKG